MTDSFAGLPVAALRHRAGVVTEANPAAVALLDLAVGAPFLDAFPPVERDAVAGLTDGELVVRMRTGKELFAVRLVASTVDDVTTIVASDVTEETRYHAVLDSAFKILNVVDDTGTVFWVSEQGRKQSEAWGFDYERVKSTPLLEWTHPEDIPKVLELLTAALHGKIERALWSTRWHPPGIDEWYESRHLGWVAFENPDIGGIVHAQLDQEDINDTIDAGTDEWRLFTLADAAPVGMLVAGRDGYISYYNQLARELLGELDPTVGNWFRSMRDEFQGDVQRLWDGAMAGTCGRCVAAVDRGPEDRVWLEVTVAPQSDVEGHVTGVIATLVDITESVLARRDAERVLRVLDLGHDFVIITDAAGNVVHRNRAAEERLDVSVHLFGLDVLAALADRGTWTGELSLRHVDGHSIPVSVVATAERNADGEIETFAFVCRDISDMKAVEQQLRELATHDPLTGLTNRALLLERLNSALWLRQRNGHPVALLFCDLDDFKNVNDDAGHEAGDAVLYAIAQRLMRVARTSDTVARIGGDEFVILCESFDSIEGLRALAQRIVRVVAEPVEVNGRRWTLGVSVGVAVADENVESPEALLDTADREMYAEKRRRKENVA